MANELAPLVNQWYAHRDKGQRFYVTAVNDDGTIEVQHFDSDIEEFNLEEWRALDIELGEAPENWTGALDVAERDDLGTEITDTNRDDWTNPLQEFRTEGQEKLSPSSPSSSDDYGEGYMEEDPLE